MSREIAVSRQPAVRTTEAPSGILQRKCSCGQHTSGGTCESCRAKKARLRTGSGLRKLDQMGAIAASPIGVQGMFESGASSDFSRVPTSSNGARLQPKTHIGAPNDAFEQEADRVADRVMRTSPPQAIFGRPSHAAIQRACARGEDTDALGDLDSELRRLEGVGRPLPESARSFFEQRMGHDFGAVRIHADGRADRLARSVQARAFTYGRNIVLARSEANLESSVGKRLLAHELTHAIQQGAALPIATADLSSARAPMGVQRLAAPAIQRTCADLVSPPPMPCDIARDSPGSGATFVEFGFDSPALSPAALATLQSIASAFHAGGGAGVLRIDGFASIEGGEAHNCPLSCERAMAVATELMAPSNGDPGVPAANIETFAQGETDQFSTSSLAPNRRAVITTSGGAPAPGPACGLTVTGPDEVDHFCAAYVPSDAASCGTFPAPNITLNVAGAAAGATPSWSVIRGAANASIVGANTGNSVAIRGDAPSAAQGDVTVQVTDGACTTTHLLTVREPSQLTAAETPSSGPTFVQDIITYTVRDQFGNPMGAGICVDETITICANSHAVPFAFGDAPTNAAGRVTDTLNVTFPGGLPATLCIKLNQSLTAGGCGPLLNNTIVFQQAGVTLNQNDNCAAGDACP